MIFLPRYFSVQNYRLMLFFRQFSSCRRTFRNQVISYILSIGNLADQICQQVQIRTECSRNSDLNFSQILPAFLASMFHLTNFSPYEVKMFEHYRFVSAEAWLVDWQKNFERYTFKIKRIFEKKAPPGFPPSVSQTTAFFPWKRKTLIQTFFSGLLFNGVCWWTQIAKHCNRKWIQGFFKHTFLQF